MDDPAVPDERPPYWSKCENMTFLELYRYLDHAVAKRSDPLDPSDEPRPRSDSEAELLALCDMLQAKADAPMPKPTYDGPEPPGEFTPSYELRSLYSKRKRHEKRVDQAYRDGESEVYIEHVEEELAEVERDLYPVETKERQKHDERIDEYLDARSAYRDRVRQWEAEEEERQRTKGKRDEIVRRMYRRVKRAPAPRTSPPRVMETLPFEIAAPGERTNDHIRAYYQEVLSRGQRRRFLQERFEKMLALPWTNWRKGIAGKKGYIVLMFEHTDKVLLECPIYPNAMFVLNSGEERLLKMKKPELIASDEVERIFHSGDWYRRVREALDLPPTSEER